MPSKNFKAGLQTMGGGLKDNYGELPVGDNGTQNKLSERLLQKLEKAAEGLPIVEIEIARLEDNPYQQLARPDSLNSEALEQLVSSIKQRGFYGTLVARRKPNALEKYQLAYGHRRRAAALEAGLDRLPVKVVDLSDAELFEIMASENLVRDDLTPIGQANLVGHLYTTNNMTLDQIGQVLHKKRSWCQLRLSLYEAPADIKAMVTQRPNTLSYVNLIKQVSENSSRSRIIAAIVNEGLSRTELQKQIEHLTNNQYRDEPYDMSELLISDDEFDDITNQHIVNNSTSGLPATASENSHNVLQTNKKDQAVLKADSSVPLAKIANSAVAKLRKATANLEFVILTNAGNAALEEIDSNELKALADRVTLLAITLVSKPVPHNKKKQPKR